MSPDLAFALELADLADSLTLPRFRSGDLHVETKSDLTPVTEADLLVERTLRHRIEVQRPGDGVLGEEDGDTGGSVRWTIDPIDGTKNFVRGVPVWATLLALERDGEVVCGVVSAPALGHRWWAARGEGAFRDVRPLHVSRVPRLAEAAVSCAHGRDLAVLEPAVWHARGLGEFWQNALVAEGSLDAAVDARLALWDYAPLLVLVEEAGGRATAPDGGPVRAGEQFVCSNGLCHDELLAALATTARPHRPL